ncbi:MAG: hypothetical protein KF795_15470 [Labilithrix sp.]|nr:hypothetical protein [Labilithrix sp.]
MEATIMTRARAIFSEQFSRVRFYDSIVANDEGHPVDIIVRRWAPHAPEHRRILSLQDQLLAVLAPETLRAFLELEELRNEIAAEREEAYFDLGTRYGIDRERRRLRGLAPDAARLAARLARAIERTGLIPDEAPFGLAAVVAEWCVSVLELRADERKSRRRRGAPAGST